MSLDIVIFKARKSNGAFTAIYDNTSASFQTRYCSAPHTEPWLSTKKNGSVCHVFTGTNVETPELPPAKEGSSRIILEHRHINSDGEDAFCFRAPRITHLEFSGVDISRISIKQRKRFKNNTIPIRVNEILEFFFDLGGDAANPHPEITPKIIGRIYGDAPLTLISDNKALRAAWKKACTGRNINIISFKDADSLTAGQEAAGEFVNNHPLIVDFTQETEENLSASSFVCWLEKQTRDFEGKSSFTSTKYYLTDGPQVGYFRTIQIDDSPIYLEQILRNLGWNKHDISSHAVTEGHKTKFGKTVLNLLFYIMGPCGLKIWHDWANLPDKSGTNVANWMEKELPGRLTKHKVSPSLESYILGQFYKIEALASSLIPQLTKRKDNTPGFTENSVDYTVYEQAFRFNREIDKQVLASVAKLPGKKKNKKLDNKLLAEALNALLEKKVLSDICDTDSLLLPEEYHDLINQHNRTTEETRAINKILIVASYDNKFKLPYRSIKLWCRIFNDEFDRFLNIHTPSFRSLPQKFPAEYHSSQARTEEGGKADYCFSNSPYGKFAFKAPEDLTKCIETGAYNAIAAAGSDLTKDYLEKAIERCWFISLEEWILNIKSSIGAGNLNEIVDAIHKRIHKRKTKEEIQKVITSGNISKRDVRSLTGFISEEDDNEDAAAQAERKPNPENDTLESEFVKKQEKDRLTAICGNDMLALADSENPRRKAARNMVAGVEGPEGTEVCLNDVSILIVEDHKAWSDPIKSTLEKAGAAVKTAEDYTSARDTILAADFDLVILDLNLPIGPNDKVCEKLYGEEPGVWLYKMLTTNQRPVLLLSSYIPGYGNTKRGDANYKDYPFAVSIISKSDVDAVPGRPKFIGDVILNKLKFFGFRRVAQETLKCGNITYRNGTFFVADSPIAVKTGELPALLKLLLENPGTSIDIRRHIKAGSRPAVIIGNIKRWLLQSNSTAGFEKKTGCRIKTERSVVTISAC
jgi:CheY-like chemotaxis protein